MKFELEIQRISIVVGLGCDIVYIYTNLPYPLYSENNEETLNLRFETQPNTGVQYVKDNFKMIPEIIKAK